jgi:DNA-binding NtrC family response regulator
VFKIAILDKQAEDKRRDYQQAADRRRMSMRFEAFAELQHFYEAIRKRSVDLALIHHTWDGVGIAEILDFIAAQSPGTRIIVFTGRKLVLPELILCARSGVADYWEIGSLSVDFTMQRIVQLCNNESAVVGKLRLASEPVLKLARQAEEFERATGSLEKQVATLQELVAHLRSVERRDEVKEAIRIIRVVVYFATLCAVTVTLNKFTSLGTESVVGIVGIFSIFILFAEGVLAKALIKWKGGSVDLQK